eukprot:scaffold125131_cov20-Prasinocladus_malaysianus.AAC.1
MMGCSLKRLIVSVRRGLQCFRPPEQSMIAHSALIVTSNSLQPSLVQQARLVSLRLRLCVSAVSPTQLQSANRDRR